MSVSNEQMARLNLLPTELVETLEPILKEEIREIYEATHGRDTQRIRRSLLRIVQAAYPIRASEDCVLQAASALIGFCTTRRGVPPASRHVMQAILAWREGRTISFDSRNGASPPWKIDIIPPDEQERVALIHVYTFEDGPAKFKFNEAYTNFLNGLINESIGGAWK